MFKYFFCGFILLSSSPLKNKGFENYWVVWNIGQGLWVTHATGDTCLHFDIGGELGRFRAIKLKLKKLCGEKRNHLILSHWDFDHYAHIPDLVKNLQRVCWQFKPELGGKKGALIQRILQLRIPYCVDDSAAIKYWLPQNGKTTNDRSLVNYSQRFLLPGDSTKKAEKIWTKKLHGFQDTRVLILGHHGSRTSTSLALLDKIPQLKMAVASARQSRYGHPHREVLQRLANKKTPVLKTEDWGSIWFL